MSTNLHESGVEYIEWTRYASGGGMERDVSPEVPCYDVLENHSNHHIIPIRKLLYLWDYFHVKDLQYTTPCFRRLDLTTQEELRRIAVTQRIQLADLEQYLEIHAEKRFNTYYSNTSKILDMLCSPLEPLRDHFSWAQWNLFKGWNKTIRGHTDPGDKVEPDKPLFFNEDLWRHVRNLNQRIDELVLGNNSHSLRNSECEKNCHKALLDLRKFIEQSQEIRQKIRRHGHFIYDFNPLDWRQYGSKDGHDLRCLIV